MQKKPESGPFSPPDTENAGRGNERGGKHFRAETSPYTLTVRRAANISQGGAFYFLRVPEF